MEGRSAVWQRLFRDVAIVVAGFFMLVHETLSLSPNPLIVGAGLTLLGVPPALRLERSRREDKDDERKP